MGVIRLEKVAKSCKKAHKFAEMCTKCAFFCKKVCEKWGFLRFCAPDFQSGVSISYVVSSISDVAKRLKVVRIKRPGLVTGGLGLELLKRISHRGHGGLREKLKNQTQINVD